MTKSGANSQTGEQNRQARQRANRKKWNAFRASFGLPPRPQYNRWYNITAAEAQAEVDTRVKMGQKLVPIVPLGSGPVSGSSTKRQKGGNNGEDSDVDMESESESGIESSPLNLNRGVTTGVSKDLKSQRKSMPIDTEEDEDFDEVVIDAASGVALAEFLKTRSKKFLIEMQKELMETDPRAFDILNDAFKELSLGPQPHQNPHVSDVVYNPYKKKGPWPVNVELPEETPDFLTREREKVEACKVDFDAEGRGLNAMEFVKKNIQGYIKTSAGTRRIAAECRVLYASSTRDSREEFFDKISSDREKGIAEVERIYNSHFVTGYRLCTTVREAFHVVIRDLKGPKSIFVNSSDWFLQTLEVVNSHPEFCLLFFEENTEKFLEMLKGATMKADLLRRHSMMEAREEERYADLMGEESDRVFDDTFERVPAEMLFGDEI